MGVETPKNSAVSVSAKVAEQSPLVGIKPAGSIDMSVDSAIKPAVPLKERRPQPGKGL